MKLTLEEAKKKVQGFYNKGLSREEAVSIVKELALEVATNEPDEALKYLDWLFGKDRQILGVELDIYRLDGVPPTFEFQLDGKRKMPVPVKHTSLMNPGALDNLFLAYWGKAVVGDLPPARWRKQVIAYFESGKVRKRRTMTDEITRVVMATKRWLAQRGLGEKYSDIQAGCYTITKHGGHDYYAIDPMPLFHWLARDLKHPVKDETVEYCLRQIGMRTGVQVRVDNPGDPDFRPYLWVIPKDKLDALGGGRVKPAPKSLPLPLEVSDDVPEI